MREILKVRRVGGTLVVTLPQAVLDAVRLEEGDRILVEAIPPRRILISKETIPMPTTRRVELELEILEAKHRSLDSQIPAAVAGYNSSSSIHSSDLEDFINEIKAERDKVAISMAEKRLELFDLQGGESFVVHRWNLNAEEGRYVQTNIRDPRIQVELGLKTTESGVARVGRFNLNLEELADQGVTTRRRVEGKEVFDVQIRLEPDGGFSLGVRQSRKLPLAQFSA